MKKISESKKHKIIGEGRSAGWSGKNKYHNPYPYKSEEYSAWLSGWKFGNEDWGKWSSLANAQQGADRRG